MSFLLAIETTTKNCSVAIFDNEVLLYLKEHRSDKYLHSEQLILFIEEVLQISDINLKELNAIALSKGPGSYTGLRIGTSTAKGLCYSLDIPLVSISTLQAMAFSVSSKYKTKYKYYCPMIDARRSEVYAAVYDQNNNQMREIKADIVDGYTYSEFLEFPVLFFGDGALKTRPLINNVNASFQEDIFPSAKNLGVLASNKFKRKEFEDVAYFEPYYLKDFIVNRLND